MSRLTPATTTRVTGLKSAISTRTGRENISVSRVALREARILGIVSPKMITSSVTISVASQVYPTAFSLNTSTEASADEAIFTRLFPTRMVLSARSKRSWIHSASAARLLPSSFSCSRRTLLQELSAISDALKKAEKATQSRMAAARIQIGVIPSRPPLPSPPAAGAPSGG